MRYIEEQLALPVRKVLQILQDRIVNATTYHGVRTWKNPLDFWVYQEIVTDLEPDFIIEIGNYCGGNLLAMAHICDVLGKGRVIGLDKSHDLVAKKVRSHPRVTLVEGEACSSFDTVRKIIGESGAVLIIEDSSHTYENTLSVLRTFGKLVTPGSYFIVEDGICHHGLPEGPMPGPYEAAEDFIQETKDFVVDRDKESFLITWNPKGFLKRVDEG